jgi:serine/threonine protein phosphatase 1
MTKQKLRYAIGDIHGMLDALREIEGKIARHAARHGDDAPTVIYLGDYIDRGPDSRGVIDHLINNPCRFRQILLKGNHEELAISDWDLWLDNGGVETLRSFGLTRPPLPSPIISWINQLKFFHRDGKWFFVHAGIDPERPLNSQSASTMLWIRRPFLDWRGSMPEDVTVIHGHTPERKRIVSHLRIGLDQGACYGGLLACGVFSDTELVDVLEVRT